MKQLPPTERRLFRRIRINMPVRLLIQKHIEANGTAISMSAGSLAIASQVHVKPGDQIVAYLHGVDRFEGVVRRQMGNMFSMTLKISEAKRERVVDALTVELAKQDGIVEATKGAFFERRTALRHRSLSRDAICTLSSGLSMKCAIVDMSLTGLSVKIEPVLKIHETVQVGRMKARVIRKTDAGYGLQIIGLAEQDVVGSIFSQSRSDKTETAQATKLNGEGDPHTLQQKTRQLASAAFMETIVKPSR